MPVKPPQPTGPDSRAKSFDRFSGAPQHALQSTIRRVQDYLKGKGSHDAASLAIEVKSLTPADWCAALPEPRGSRKLVYLERCSVERRPDKRDDPFETVWGRELLSRLEAGLPPEQIPYLDAFLAGDKPKDVAQRLGISPKAASARMRRFKAKVAELYAALRIR